MADVKTHKIGIMMNGVTGRMGTNQHLMRSLLAIIKQGGVKVGPNEVIVPDVMLCGSLSDPRNPKALEELSASSGIEKWSTDVEGLLENPDYPIYFDSQATTRRFEWVSKALEAGKHVYCEKPTAVNTEDAYQLYRTAKEKGVKNGVVQDKLWLPGFLKLQKLIEEGFFGEILSVCGDFGYWVFEGEPGGQPSQRPSWNYRKEDGGGMIIDMVCHYRYVIANIFGPIKSVNCLASTLVKQRWDEKGDPYKCTADDAAFSTFELENGIIVHINSSWATRVRRDDLFVLQVDGTKGSAVVGLRNCLVQSAADTPRPVWNPDIDQEIDFYEGWKQVPGEDHYENAFKIQWEMFLKHVVLDAPFKWSLLEGAKGVQLADLAIESSKKRSWVDVQELEA